jgi:Rps23 Pro-64 3,4-dihydroxylase Tpa1-like proline 4-hydroxylase
VTKEKPFKWGRIAYVAFCAQREWKAQDGGALASFERLSPSEQTAWAVAAEAVMLAEYREGISVRRKCKP